VGWSHITISELAASWHGVRGSSTVFVFACLCIRHRKYCASDVAFKPSKLKEIDGVGQGKVCVHSAFSLCRWVAPLQNAKFGHVLNSFFEFLDLRRY